MSDENTQTILERLDRIEANQETMKIDIEVFIKVSEGYQRAADRVGNLAFTVVGAAAAIAVISPAVKALTEYAIN